MGPKTRTALQHLPIGIDVSKWQGPIDWGRIRGAGVSFVYVKATEGIGHIDPLFEVDYKGAKTAGLLVGAYHFYRPQALALIQATHFLNAIRGLSLDLPPALDLEVLDREPGAAVRGNAARWLEYVEARWGKRPLLYTYAAFASENHLGAELGAYPLWLADYREVPHLPEGWERWWAWQRSGKGHVSGIGGDVDLDIFGGRLEDLKALAG
jgi:lysozyme